MPDGGARGVRRRVPVGAPARQGVKLRQLDTSVAVRGRHHRQLRPDTLQPRHAVHPTALDERFALQLESELEEERGRGGEVVDHDAHVIHALDRHEPDCSDTTAQLRPLSVANRLVGTPPIGPERPAMNCSGSIGSLLGYASPWKTVRPASSPSAAGRRLRTPTIGARLCGAESARGLECRWHREQLPAVIRELVPDDQRLRNEICWSVFDC